MVTNHASLPNPARAVVKSPEALRALGERLGRLLRPGDVVLLHGDLGAGKTTLTQGIAAGLGVADVVQSPTFTIVNEYRVGDPASEIRQVNHVDLYRLGADDLEGIGLDDYLLPEDAVTVVEWPERALARLPEGCLLLTLEPVREGRLVTLASAPPDGRLAGIAEALRADAGSD